MNTTTLLPLEKNEDVDVELSYQKTNTIAIKNNKKKNKRFNNMVLFGGIIAMTVAGAVVATSNSNLLANTNGGDKNVVISSYTCKQLRPDAPWKGFSDYNAYGEYQTCWKNGPNDWQGLCYTNNYVSTLPCKPKGSKWRTLSNHRVSRSNCGTQCTSLELIHSFSF